jgi:hypothetical protein
MGQASVRLRAEGVESLAVVATTPENARFYFRFRPPQMRVAADPAFTTHRRYGVLAARRGTALAEAARATLVNPTGELPAPVPMPDASAALSRLDGYEPTAADREDAARPVLQFLGQFLMDRQGTVRWTNLECPGGDLSGIGQFPTEDELLAAVRALPR